MVFYRLLDGLKIQMSKACIDCSGSMIFQHKRRPRVTKYKKYILGSHTCPLKFIFAPLKAKHFIGQLWQLMTASNVGARTQAWQAKWAVFKIPGFVCKRFLPFFPTPSPHFYLRHFSRGLSLIPRSLLLNFTEMLATQARIFLTEWTCNYWMRLSMMWRILQIEEYNCMLLASMVIMITAHHTKAKFSNSFNSYSFKIISKFLTSLPACRSTFFKILACFLAQFQDIKSINRCFFLQILL